MDKKYFVWNFFASQHFTSQYEDKVWPLPSGLIYAGAPPLICGLV
jgi:hypothetical protein